MHLPPAGHYPIETARNPAAETLFGEYCENIKSKFGPVGRGPRIDLLELLMFLLFLHVGAYDTVSTTGPRKENFQIWGPMGPHMGLHGPHGAPNLEIFLPTGPGPNFIGNL